MHGSCCFSSQDLDGEKMKRGLPYMTFTQKEYTKFADKQYINFADRAGEGVRKSKIVVDVIYGSPQRAMLSRMRDYFCLDITLSFRGVSAPFSQFRRTL